MAPPPPPPSAPSLVGLLAAAALLASAAAAAAATATADAADASSPSSPRLVTIWGVLKSDPPRQRTAVGALNLTSGAIAWSAPFEIPLQLDFRAAAFAPSAAAAGGAPAYIVATGAPGFEAQYGMQVVLLNGSVAHALRTEPLWDWPTVAFDARTGLAVGFGFRGDALVPSIATLDPADGSVFVVDSGADLAFVDGFMASECALLPALGANGSFVFVADGGPQAPEESTQLVVVDLARGKVTARALVDNLIQAVCAWASPEDGTPLVLAVLYVAYGPRLAVLVSVDPTATEWAPTVLYTFRKGLSPTLSGTGIIGSTLVVVAQDEATDGFELVVFDDLARPGPLSPRSLPLDLSFVPEGVAGIAGIA